MKAIVYHGKEDFRLEQISDARLQEPMDALVRVEKTAICGSDLHLWHAEAYYEQGFATGHEFLGIVEDTGSGVQSIRKGDRVFVSCTTGCGNCDSCRRGYYSGCSVMTEGGTRNNVFGFSSFLPGGQAEAVRVPFADVNCFVLPGDLDAEDCLFLTDILPTGYMGADLADVGPGDRVVVFGCGPVGTFAQRSAAIRGASQVIAVDLDEGRLKRAQERGCIPVNPASGDLVGQISEITGGRLADAAIEAVGLPDLVGQAAMVTRPGGNVAVIGVIGMPFEVPWPILFSRNISLKTGLVNPQIYIPSLLPLIEQERLHPGDIISHRLSLDEGVKGYEIFAGHREDVLKVVLTP